MSKKRAMALKEKALKNSQGKHSGRPGGKVCAALSILGKSVYHGGNWDKSHPAGYKDFDSGSEIACTHAEVDSLMKVPRQSRWKVRLYVIRFRRSDGQPTMAKPCERCQLFLRLNGVTQVWYTTWEGSWAKL